MYDENPQLDLIGFYNRGFAIQQTYRATSTDMQNLIQTAGTKVFESSNKDTEVYRMP